MKAVLNVEGKRFEVVNISYSAGKVVYVAVEFGDIIKSFYNHGANWVPENAGMTDLNESLEFIPLQERAEEKWTSLIKHLEEVAANEHETLVNLAVNVMEDDSSPFNEQPLVEGQREYKLMEQRVLGVIDTVEEVKAFMEGWYLDDDTTTADETEVANQTT